MGSSLQVEAANLTNTCPATSIRLPAIVCLFMRRVRFWLESLRHWSKFLSTRAGDDLDEDWPIYIAISTAIAHTNSSQPEAHIGARLAQVVNHFRAPLGAEAGPIGLQAFLGPLVNVAGSAKGARTKYLLN